VRQQWPATSVQPFVFVRKDRRLLYGAVDVLDTVVPCENSLAWDGLLFITVFVVLGRSSK